MRQRLLTPAKVIIVSSVMFTFISYWRTAAVVLCDLASTSYYIGGIVETAIGKAAPWFILGVMLLSGAVCLVYIESCTLFIRSGVYRVVREALGRFFAKFAVSALLFDFILTGPISGVSAGQYIMGLGLEAFKVVSRIPIDKPTEVALREYCSMVIAILITLYFFRQNLVGLHESSDKALKIILATSIMGVTIIGWSIVTLVLQGSQNSLPPLAPDLNPHMNYSHFPPVEENPLGFLDATGLADHLRSLSGQDWLSLIGVLGVLLAFGHSILAMSGLETLAQVYREVEAPKLPNFQRAAWIVFLFSLLLTGSISFLAVMLIPDKERMPEYSDNLIGGLAMNVVGPIPLRFGLRVFVVVIGFLILSGAVNTAIIGSNGVLNRVAEDGVLHDWFLKPHPRYGTTARLLWLIVGLQIFVILLSKGNVILLGEAYAFGVVWSFVFQALSMVVLRFKDRRPREYKVPLNLRVGDVDVPIGLSFILVILLVTAILNLLTKQTATILGGTFTLLLFSLFTATEWYHDRRRRGARHEHVEQFNRAAAAEVTAATLSLDKMYRKLVSIRSTRNLFMLEKALAETDPETTEMVVMTAKLLAVGETPYNNDDLDAYDQQLMTAVVQRAERAGKEVKPLIVPTNNPLHAILNTAKDLQAHELIMGASNKYTADEQLEQIAFYWISLHGGNPTPLTVRILSRDRDMYLDLAGGNRIPKISERKARSVAELRAAGVGVDRVLLAHDGSSASSDLFQAVLTMLDPQVQLALIPIVPPGQAPLNGHNVIHLDEERARQLDRELTVIPLKTGDGPEIVQLAREERYDLIILPLHSESTSDPIGSVEERTRHILGHAHCRVLLAAAPVIPQEVVDTTPSLA